jgi:predicted ATPase
MADHNRRFATPTRLVGREKDISELEHAVAANRVVTLIGASGVGKTRLALEIAARLSAQFPDGMRFVDLAVVSDPELVPRTAARQLGVDAHAHRSTNGTLVDYVGDRKMLVVLDNCGHLLRACESLITALRDATFELTFVATSPEAIGIAGELTLRVLPLSATDDAVELFAERACNALPGFRITDENRPVVVQLCRRLGGIPGAIELAAARINTMPPREIYEAILDWFRLFTGSAHGQVRNEHIMLAAVAWSYRLCPEQVRALLRRLAVFRGALSLDAARSIGASNASDDVDGCLSMLVANSLVDAEELRGAVRYRLSEAVREYAAVELSKSGEADTVRQRHWRHYAARAGLLAKHAAEQQPTNWAVSDFANLLAATDWKREALDIT